MSKNRDDVEYDYDFMPTKAYDYVYNNKLREEQAKNEEAQKENRLRMIRMKGGYGEPDELMLDYYFDFVSKTKSRKDNMIYDDYDAERLLDFVKKLVPFYADTLYRFYSEYAPNKIESFSPYILDKISGNKLENEEIIFDKELSKINKTKFLISETDLKLQRIMNYVKQTHHPRRVQPLFNQSNRFLKMQQRALQARIMDIILSSNIKFEESRYIKKKYLELKKHGFDDEYEIFELHKHCFNFIDDMKMFKKNLKFIGCNKEGEQVINNEFYEETNIDEAINEIIKSVGGATIEDCHKINRVLEKYHVNLKRSEELNV